MLNLYSRIRPRLGQGILLALCTLFGLGSQSRLFAQASAYSFSNIQGTYQEIVPTEVLTTGLVHDESAWQRPIGFPFRMAGIPFNNIVIGTNGVVAFGTFTGTGISGSASNSYHYSVIGNFTNAFYDLFDYNEAGFSRPDSMVALIAAFPADQRNNTATTGTISYTTEGVAPNRVLVVQYKNWRRWTYNSNPSGITPVGDDDLNYQVRLYEGSNNIEVVYGQITLASPFITQLGIRGPQTNSRDVLVLNGTSFNNASRGSDVSAQIPVGPGNEPTVGRTLRYAPIPPIPNDLGVTSFISPRADQTTCLLSANEIVRVAVRNYGTNSQTSANVSYRVNGGPVRTQTFPLSPAPLARDGVDTVSFSLANAANLSTAGTYNFIAWTTLAGDTGRNRGNDTARFTVNLSGPVFAPIPPITTLAELTGEGWDEGTGANMPSGNTSQWTTGFPINSATISLPFNNSNTNLHTSMNEWIVSPNYLITPGTFLVFKAYVNNGTSGSTRPVGLNDDSVRVRISEDCGNTWRTLKSFSQRDLDSNIINNVPKEFQYRLSTTASSVRVAFQGTSNGTIATNTWRFNLDDIEFREVLPNDMGAIALVSPLGSQPGCLLSTTEEITVRVRNYGSLAQSSVPVAYTVNGGAAKQQTFTFTPPIQPGEEREVTFTGANRADLSVAGTYNFIVYTRLPGEQSRGPLNDTAKNIQPVVLSAPLALDPLPPLGTTYAILNTNGWRRGIGTTRPEGTISGWGSTFGGGGSYTGITFPSTITSNPVNDWFFSPSYQGSAFTSISFKAAVIGGGNVGPAQDGMGDDTVKLGYSTDCGSTWTFIRSFTQADLANNTLTNVLSAFTEIVSVPANSRVSFGFYAKSNNTPATTAYRFILDDVRVKTAVQNDQGISAVVGPVNNPTNCALGSVAPSVRITNYGVATQTTSTIKYSVNGGTPVSETFTLTPPLATNQTRVVTFSQANAIDFSAPGRYSITVYTEIAGEDEDSRRNDTLKNYVINVTAPNTLAAGQDRFTETFDTVASNANLPANWISEGVSFSDFKIEGIRGVGLSNSLTAGFLSSNLSSFFISPRYTVPSAAGTVLQYDYRIVEFPRDNATLLTVNDSIVLEVTSDCGQTYTRLDLINSTNHVATNQYVTKFYDLTPYANQVVSFRMRAGFARQGDPSGARLDIDNWGVGTYVSNRNRFKLSGFSLAPNPANQVIKISGPAEKGTVATVIGADGRRLLQTRLADGQAELRISTLPAGLYKVLIATPTGASQVLSLIKE